MCRWYSKYLELLLKKKEAIRQWRYGRNAKQKLEEQMRLEAAQVADASEEVRYRHALSLQDRPPFKDLHNHLVYTCRRKLCFTSILEREAKPFFQSATLI